MLEDLIYLKAGIGVDAESDADGNDELMAVDLDGGRDRLKDLPAILVHVLYVLEVGKDDNELVSADTRHGVALANRGEQALAQGREQGIAGGVSEGIVDALEVVDVEHEDGDLMVFPAGAQDGAFEAFVKQSAVGQTCELIVVGEEVHAIRDLLACSEVATGDGDFVADPDGLDVDPGGMNGVIVDEDLIDVGDASPHDIFVPLEDAGGDGVRADLREDPAEKLLARDPEAALGGSIDVAEAKVRNLAVGVGNSFEEIEVVEIVLSGLAEEVGFLRGDGRKTCPEGDGDESSDKGGEKLRQGEMAGKDDGSKMLKEEEQEDAESQRENHLDALGTMPGSIQKEGPTSSTDIRERELPG